MAAGLPMGNVEIPWKNEGSPRFPPMAQPQALRAILEILRHRRNLQKRRKRQKKPTLSGPAENGTGKKEY